MLDVLDNFMKKRLTVVRWSQALLQEHANRTAIGIEFPPIINGIKFARD